jgi:hypothetical protein
MSVLDCIFVPEYGRLVDSIFIYLVAWAAMLFVVRLYESLNIVNVRIFKFTLELVFLFVSLYL